MAAAGAATVELLLSGAGPERADEVARTISAAMEERARTGDTVLLTVSYGTTEVDLVLDEAIERADKALHRAKESGRDRAVHFSPDLA